MSCGLRRKQTGGCGEIYEQSGGCGEVYEQSGGCGYNKPRQSGGCGKVYVQNGGCGCNKPRQSGGCGKVYTQNGGCGCNKPRQYGGCGQVYVQNGGCGCNTPPQFGGHKQIRSNKSDKWKNEVKSTYHDLLIEAERHGDVKKPTYKDAMIIASEKRKALHPEMYERTVAKNNRQMNRPVTYSSAKRIISQYYKSLV